VMLKPVSFLDNFDGNDLNKRDLGMSSDASDELIGGWTIEVAAEVSSGSVECSCFVRDLVRLGECSAMPGGCGKDRSEGAISAYNKKSRRTDLYTPAVTVRVMPWLSISNGNS
jgi:hypothetical protein